MLNKLLTLTLISSSLLLSSQVLAATCDDFTNVELRKLRSQDTLNLCQFKNKPLLIVNTASNCGFTGQFEDL
ncbi:glutathione peroxidase, partial [Pseudoalteromonas ruthenica]